MAPELQHDEHFTRFLLSSTHFAAQKGRVKPSALLPRFNTSKDRWETSVHRTANLSTVEVWKLGYRYVEDPPHGRQVKARASGPVALIHGQGLDIDVNGAPYPRHTDIIKWPDTDKDVRLMKATEIAEELHLLIDPRTESSRQAKS